MIIAIDGPVATGKSTLARSLAEEIGFIYFDTGAMYRCLTYGVLKRELDLQDKETLQKFLAEFALDIRIKRGERRYFYDKVDITEEIRDQMVTDAVSEISALQEVRDKLVFLQRNMSIGVNAVFEGRDMGSVVFPKAEVKIFLTAKAEVRAKRRLEELLVKFPHESSILTYEKILEDINKRDNHDMQRKNSPLIQAEDAFLIDTSDLSIEEITYRILEYKDTLLTRPL